MFAKHKSSLLLSVNEGHTSAMHVNIKLRNLSGCVKSFDGGMGKTFLVPWR